MSSLSAREVRLLCWKVKRGEKLPRQKLFALLEALLQRRRPRRRRAANDNTRTRLSPCNHRDVLFAAYTAAITRWMQKVSALGNKRTGRRAEDYPALWREVVAARVATAQAHRDYQRHISKHHCANPYAHK